jgi:hypothetical protein
MPAYFVEWQIEVDAPDAVEAAREALAVQRDQESGAVIFNVIPLDDPTAGATAVDLDEL